ncbi:acyl-CoA dehydrogenase family protein [Algiphilus sp.]|uniref:acyl-CoA dehydrogenase family protein n=1 Tax=Algiphilus sp. TaxID=1872431 RepID=UPI003B522179
MQSNAQSAVSVVSPEVLLQRARDLVPKIAERAPETAQNRRIPDETIQELQDAGLFRVLQPKAYGGYEMDPNVFYDIAMILAEGCMSTAWVYGIVGVHNWQLALFDPRAAEDVWKDDTSTLVASTYMPKGQVTPVEGGFKFSGRWGFSSGIDHCEWVLLGGLIFNEGQPPEYRTFLVPRSDFRVEDTWHTMGLKGTGSNDIIVEDAFVPEYRTHKATDGFNGTNPGKDTFTAPLYKIPFGQIFVRAVSSAAIGALVGATKVFQDWATDWTGNMGSKTAEQAPAQMAVADALVAADEMKLVLHRNFDEILDSVRQNKPLSIERRLHFRYQAAQVVDRCAERVSRLMGAAGGRGIFTDFSLHRYFLDVHTARAHYANNAHMFGSNFGGVMLGRDNTDVFI